MNQITRKIKIDNVDDKYMATVTLSVSMDDGASYYLIDEIFPEGWTVVDASDYGSYKMDPGHIKWVVIQGACSKDYIYNMECINPLEVNTFHGLYMFEGDHTEQPIRGQSVLKITEGEVEQIKAYELVADDAVRTSYLANIDAQAAIDDFVIKSRKVESLVDPTHEQERYAEHDADWSRDVAIESCKYIVEYGMVAVTMADDAMTAAVTNREVLHATGLISRSRDLAESAVKLVMTLESEVTRYSSIGLIQKRTLRAEIVIQLQKEREARAAGDMEAMEIAIVNKKAALAKLIELYAE